MSKTLEALADIHIRTYQLLLGLNIMTETCTGNPGQYAPELDGALYHCAMAQAQSPTSKKII